MTAYSYARVSVRELEDKNLNLQVERWVRSGWVGAFREQAAASDVMMLHCRIPSALHSQLRRLEEDEDSGLTAIVIEMMEEGLPRRSR